MRLKSYAYGIAYWRNADFAIPGVLRINGKKKPVKFLEPANSGFMYEFTEICLKDCYQLALLKKQLGAVNAIVDIGANQGLFAIAARQHFSKAAISCWEPNKELREVLDINTAAAQAEVFYEAVTREDCKVTLRFGETDLHTIAQPGQTGEIPGTAFQEVIERAGGSIDILKMDCEGGEWPILEDKDSWTKVRAVTMEYHLWAKEGSSVDELKQILNNLGFQIIVHNPLNIEFGLITAVK